MAGPAIVKPIDSAPKPQHLDQINVRLHLHTSLHTLTHSENHRKNDHVPPYTPMPSLGHELGIMFGFIGACVFTMVAYTLFWRAAQRRAKDEDLARRKAFHTSGTQRLHDTAGGATGVFDKDSYGPFGPGVGMRMGGKSSTFTPNNVKNNGNISGKANNNVHEKMFDRHAPLPLPPDRVELPVHLPGDGAEVEVPVMLQRSDGSRAQLHLEEQVVFQRGKLGGAPGGKGTELEFL
ncbi:hypothetical protein N7510_007716 [Penicillium lagena]|uniref:uncharacterized protein n=1 Tax=Penicillium lagena TaxID=94218 RepID=UPI0025402ED5|nr:uncharacterized protein N7510_007716 [Penicillium lagena]KAJ5610997.1 hypothetical protein N7510_007716 [Penicillium lagena]